MGLIVAKSVCALNNLPPGFIIYMRICLSSKAQAFQLPVQPACLRYRAWPAEGEVVLPGQCVPAQASSPRTVGVGAVTGWFQKTTAQQSPTISTTWAKRPLAGVALVREIHFPFPRSTHGPHQSFMGALGHWVWTAKHIKMVGHILLT